jgi:hypothetical protein
MKIVVSRYNEDVSWTKGYDGVIIYNKGSPLGYPNEITLANVGREGHTYYKYICDNYASLDDYTVFLQGYPFDHSPNVLQTLNTYNTSKKPLFAFISERVQSNTFQDQIQKYEECFTIMNTYEKILGVKPDSNDECIFGEGAQFIVSKEFILKKPLSFYQNIVNILSYHVCPVEGYHVERLHKYILT